MYALTDKIYSFCVCSVKVLGLMLAAFLFAGSFLVTSYSTDMESQTVLFRADNPLWNLLGIAVFSVIFIPAVRRRKVRTNRLLFLTLGWCCFAGAFLIVFGRTAPAADGMSVYAAAGELAVGQTAVISPDNSYFSYYPQQIGLVCFYEIGIRLWNLLPFEIPAYHMIKCVNVLGACGILFFQQRTVQLLWHNERLDCIYLILAGLNLPFLMYTSFIYGEIPSFAFMAAGLYCLLCFLGDRETGSGWRQALYAVVCFSMGVALRKNNLIFVIAVLIVALLQYLRDRKGVVLMFALLCGVCAFGVLPGIRKVYELRAGNYLRSGVPAAAYFAMGMQDVPGSRCGGWYNGYNFEVYQEAGLDGDAAAAVSREAIRERLEDFKENPGYAVKFYLRKHISQWADGTYASRQATLSSFGGRGRVLQSLYEGPLSRFFIEYGNFYQNMLYLGFVVFSIVSCKGMFSGIRKQDGRGNGDGNTGERLTDSLPLWVGLIGVLGGFLFHMVWEANSRYILLYSLAMLPYSAWGIGRIMLRKTDCPL